MKAQLARIHQILGGHSDRALVHALDADGLEYKLEVPASVAGTLSPGHVLWIAWSAHVFPDAPAEPTPLTADEEFSALIGLKQQGSSQTPADAPPQSLADLLGLHLGDAPRRK